MSKYALTNRSTLRLLLDENDIDLKHSLGQNFLVSSAIIDKILQLSEVGKVDKVLEVGCGVGTLTVALLERGARVESIERDERLYSVAEQTTAEYKNDFELVKGDALDVIVDTLPFSPNKFIANLPYSVAATLILKYFQGIETLESATVMVQKEVADRICAKAGNKNYGAYTVKLGLLTKATGSFFVSRNNFFPAPHVDSAVVRLDRRDDAKKLSIEQAGALKNACTCADAAFANRRKTIMNSMVGYFGKGKGEQVSELLKSCGVDPKIRGEKLSIDVYKTLGFKFSEFFV